MSSKDVGPVRAPRRILIIKPSSLGDVVHALPVLAGLRRAHPAAHVAWLVGDTFAPLLEGHPLLDEVIRFDRRRYGRLLRSPQVALDFLRFLRGLRAGRFDLVIDLQGLFRSGFMAWCSGARRRIGFADARELAWVCYNERIRPRAVRSTRLPAVETLHAVDKNLSLARAIGLPVNPPSFPLGLRADESAAARRLVAEAAGRVLDRFIAVVPGARWETKRWPTGRLATLIDRLHADGFPPAVLLGSVSDRTLADEITRLCASPIVDLTGRTSLRELSAVLALAKLVICHDSGPMHIAAALGRPLVAVFGPTNPARTGPYGGGSQVVALPLDCAPCYRRQCPLGHHDCMKRLEVSAVLAKVRELRAGSAAAIARESVQPAS